MELLNGIVNALSITNLFYCFVGHAHGLQTSLGLLDTEFWVDSILDSECPDW